MGRFNNPHLLAIFETDTVTSTLEEPTSVSFPPKSGTGFPITTIAAYLGPRPVMITDVCAAFGDIVVTDPTADRYLGWAIWSATNGGASPTFASLAGYTANADLPHIHDNSVSTTAIQAVVNVPINLFNYVGASGDGVYATAALQPAGKKLGGIRVPANSLIQVRLGAYVDGALATIADMSDVTTFVYGYVVGAEA